MNLLRVAGASLNQTALDFFGNKQRIEAVLDQAKAAGVELLVLPELCLTGYGCEDAFFSLGTAKEAEASLASLLPATKGISVLVGMPYYYRGAMYNCAVLVQDGEPLGISAKRVLPREGVHYEPRWFRPWPFGKVVEAKLCGRTLPLGDLRYRLGELGIAVELCEEAWDNVPASAAHADDIDLILNPSASHFAMGKYVKREHLVANSSRSMQVTYVYANLVGNEAGRMIYDGGVLIAEGGEIVARGPRFGFKDAYLSFRDVNPEMASLAKLKVKPVRDQDFLEERSFSEVQGRDPRQVVCPKSHPQVLAKALGRVWSSEGGMMRTLSREEEFLAAAMLGLFDYLRKTRSKAYVLSLSGGCDSATCAVLVAHMVAEAWRELGEEGLKTRLGITSATASQRELIRELLVCVYQSTKNSGTVTREAARELAEALGAEFHVADVQAEVERYTEAAARVIGRPLSWEQDDLSLQNIQARVRAPLIWLIANLKRAVLITTSNRSEAAVGYATMDGDTAGGLAPIAGVSKHFLRQWLLWAESECTLGLGPVAALQAVNSQQPTAELRPPSEQQTDEADLMPYGVMERIERYLVRDRFGADDILEALTHDFPTIERAQLTVYLDKFFRLWAFNQWKRERFAPAFHLDELSLDPKTFCRFPILSEPLHTKN